MYSILISLFTQIHFFIFLVQDFLGNHPTPEPISILNPPKDLSTASSNIDNLYNIETSSSNEIKVTKSSSFENNIAKPITTTLQLPQEPIKGYCVREVIIHSYFLNNILKKYTQLVILFI